MSTAPAFFRLPEELLTMIVDIVVDSVERPAITPISGDRFSVLQALRETHPRFAYLKSALRRLFQTVCLPTDPVGIERLEKTTLDRFAPFVQQILFRPPSYGVEVTYDRFRGELLRQHDKSSGDERCTSCGAYGTMEDTTNDDKVAAAYEYYCEQREQEKQVMASGRAESVLLSVIDRLPDARHFVLAAWNRGRWLKRSATHRLIMQHCAERMDDALMGDELLQFTTKLIRGANMRLKSYTIGCYTTGRRSETLLEEWQSIDLSEMEGLFYYGRVFDDHTHPRDRQLQTDRIGQFYACVASQASASLRCLVLRGPLSCRWAPPSNRCPKLEYLKLEDMDLSEGFDAWLKTCTGPNRFHMASMTGVQMSTFCVLRKMQPMRIEMDQVYGTPSRKWTLDFHTGEESNYVHSPEHDSEYWLHAPDALHAFLRGAAASPGLLKMCNEEDFVMPDDG
ncbi:Hypothetical predicted protein [Lecanosticta acicola]|uniref:Uncharacterized protein n=1 Tax=Lecanosticta acicola TaxID=111012 RepID=A0AAI8YWU6_9PEZI|nr:Hypothetical predicted protein [Lecanosticta acicola]